MIITSRGAGKNHMAQQYDLPLSELQTYKPALTREADFETFWRESKQALEEHPAEATLTPVD